MSFFTNIVQALARQSGVQLPQNVQGSSKTGTGFSGLLSSLQQRNATNTNLQIPTPPKPPADATDVVGQQQYNQALLSYNQRFQTYHTKMVNTMFQRMMWMQQNMIQAQQVQQQNASSNQVNGPLVNSGIGGILGGDTDI